MNVIQILASKVFVQALMMATRVNATMVGEETIVTRVHVMNHLVATMALVLRMIMLLLATCVNVTSVGEELIAA